MFLRNLLRWSDLARNKDGRPLLQVKLEPFGNRVARGQLVLTIQQNELCIAAGRPILVLRIKENGRDRRLLLRIGLDCGTKHDVILALAFAEEGFPKRKLISNIDARDLLVSISQLHVYSSAEQVEVGIPKLILRRYKSWCQCKIENEQMNAKMKRLHVLRHATNHSHGQYILN